MENQNQTQANYEAVFFIVNDNVGSRVLHLAMAGGCSGGTIFYGRGTISDVILELFGLEESLKEVVLMVINQEISKELMLGLGKKLKLAKPDHGIAFKLPVVNVIGTNKSTLSSNGQLREENKKMHQGIITIVKQGFAEQVIEAAVAAGSKGGTIIPARGAASHESIKLFSVEVEPEKDIVLILSEGNETEKLVHAINAELALDQPGNGVLFTINLSETYGLF